MKDPSKEHKLGVFYFLNFGFEKSARYNKILCHYEKCVNIH